ncbi:MAG: adenylate/guanylate cyclase domain-containing protein [Syntrophorhabdaceae bacterium]|nr:adenylate/guanylate cyclase domain-containing protein [Syntrophorhabdaceae bacterium]
MGLKDNLVKEVKETFQSTWDVQATDTVPDPEDLRLNANHAKDLETATVLYADLDGSTNMVDARAWTFSAEVYKTYLRCAAEIIRSENGVITAYDGDRVMAVFTGEWKNTSAVRCALKINYAVWEIIRPALKTQYPSTDFVLKHVVGIDTSRLRTARIGVRGDNDLVWIGRAANYAAKLTTLSAGYIWITKSVYDKMNDSTKFSNDVNMWEPRLWTAMNRLPIYRSTYYRKIE